MTRTQQTLRAILILLGCLPIHGCASGPESAPTKAIQVRFLIAFKSTALRTAAQQQIDKKLATWQNLCHCDVQFIRSIAKDLWLVEAGISYEDDVSLPKAKKIFREKISAQADIRYVEEDQVMKLLPIEQPKYPVRVY